VRLINSGHGTYEVLVRERGLAGSGFGGSVVGGSVLGTSRGRAAGFDGWATGDVEPAALEAAGVLLAGFAWACAQHASAHGSLDTRDASTI